MGAPGFASRSAPQLAEQARSPAVPRRRGRSQRHASFIPAQPSSPPPGWHAASATRLSWRRDVTSRCRGRAHTPLGLHPERQHVHYIYILPKREGCLREALQRLAAQCGCSTGCSVASAVPSRSLVPAQLRGSAHLHLRTQALDKKMEHTATIV